MRLTRNRDFLLYQAGQLLSTAGGSFTNIAYPLLVLALTGSPAKAGLVSFARLAPAPLLGLAAGIAADRYDRRRIMLAADAFRAAAIGALALVVAFHAVFWPVPFLAFVEGTGDIFFAACLGGLLRSVVPAAQLPEAVAVQQGRSAVVGVAGPPAGGALFAVARALPFAVDAVSYIFSFAAISLMRTRFQQDRERQPLRLRADLGEAFTFLWRQPFLRVTSFFYAAGNVTIPATMFVVVVVGRRDALSGGQIGLLLATFSACLLAGSMASAVVRRRLTVRAVVLLESYSGLLLVAFLVRPSVYVLVAALLPQAVVLPITDSYVIAHRIAVTPDRLSGRVEAVRSMIARTAAPLGPLLAGVGLSLSSSRVTVAAFLTLSALVAIPMTLSSALRAPPPLETV